MNFVFSSFDCWLVDWLVTITTTIAIQGGLLQATPHAVRGMSAYADGRTSGVTRETFAVFMEPNWDGDMNVPDGRTGAQAQTQAAAAVLPAGVPPLGKRWSEGMNFGEFTERTFSEFY